MMKTSTLTIWIVFLIQQLPFHVKCLSTSATVPRKVSNAKSKATTTPTKTVLAPNTSFRTTVPGELSIGSLNVLAPTLHSLSEPEETRDQHAALDRKERIPASFKIAKQLGADILSLQEVEGVQHLPLLEKLLSCDETLEDGTIIKGYDSFSWSPLHPHRAGEVVGLCVAWRSDRHTLVSSHGFRRGLVVQLQEVDGGATFCVGNVHLPARPSDIYGRLKAVSTLCRRIEDCRPPRRSSSPLDGAAVVTGDFNCDATCSPVSLLMDGFTPHGTIFERNHRHKISKSEAKKFCHPLRFYDAYGPNVRKSQAAITVSLLGRGPGSMDHILFSPGRWGKSRAASRKPIRQEFSALSAGSRRQKRRLRVDAKVETRVSLEPPPMLHVDCLLATIDDDEDRTQTIVDGLPNLAAGFPSDHLLVGAIIVPSEVDKSDEDDSALQIAEIDGESDFGQDDKESEAEPNDDASNVKRTVRRRGARSVAVITRQRHNALLRAVSSWLMSRGVTDVIRDEPLYQWQWVEGVEYLRKKMRAPDVCCVAPTANKLLMVEVTVSKRPTSVLKHKEKKYRDLAPILSAAPKVIEAKLSVPDAFVIVISEEGTLPPDTINALEELALITAEDPTCTQSVHDDVKSIALELLRIRDHWTDC